MTDLVVRPAAVDEILPVRKGVLRPGEALEPSGYDVTPGVRHVGAFDGALCVGCATVFPSPYDDEERAWQLRGMAVEPARQGEGVGRLVAHTAAAIARQAGAPLLWANGRVTALPFYERLGWRAVGEVFSYGPATLPHRVIVLPLG